jgi:hypothetical protein
MPDTLDLDTLKDIPKEEEDFSQEFQMRLQHLGLYFPAINDARYYLFFKKLPGTNLKVEVQDAMHIFVIWFIDSLSNDILNQAEGISVGEIQVVPTTVSTTLSPPNPIEREYRKKVLTSKNVV